MFLSQLHWERILCKLMEQCTETMERQRDEIREWAGLSKKQDTALRESTKLLKEQGEWIAASEALRYVNAQQIAKILGIPWPTPRQKKGNTLRIELEFVYGIDVDPEDMEKMTRMGQAIVDVLLDNEFAIQGCVLPNGITATLDDETIGHWRYKEEE
jgi:hypothetical protein